MEKTWLYASLAVTVVCAIGRTWGDWRLVSYLRAQHPELWRAAGAPSPWFINVNDVQSVHALLFGPQDLPNDPQLRHLCRQQRRLHVIHYASLAAVLVCLVVVRVRHP